MLMDQDDPEKRIADLERQVAAPHTAREARQVRKRERRASLLRVRDEAGVNPAQRGRTSLVVFRTLLMLGALGIPVFIVGLVLRHTTSWIWIGGLALFFGDFVLICAWLVADDRKIEKVRWQEGTVTFRTVEPGRETDYGPYYDCEVELNPTGRITWVHTDKEVWGLEERRRKRLVVGATMRCLIDRTEVVALRAFPWAEPDAPLPSSRRSAAWWTSGDKLLFLEGKSRKR